MRPVAVVEGLDDAPERGVVVLPRHIRWSGEPVESDLANPRHLRSVYGSTTLVERWNGASWSIAATPNPAGGASSYLSAVACTSSTNCVAVGDRETAAHDFKTLVERYS